MKSIPFYIVLIVCSVLAYSCSEKKKDSNQNQPTSYVELKPGDDGYVDEWEEYVRNPPYLPVDSANRRMLDSCILEHDTIAFGGKKYVHSKYWLYPSIYKSFFVNYTVHTYEFKDKVYASIGTPKGRLVLCDKPSTVTIVNVSDEDYYAYRERTSEDSTEMPISFIFDVLKCDTIPIAKFKEEREDRYVKVPTWRSHYKKVYTRTGLQLKNTDGENNEWFLEYPTPARKGASKKELRKSAKQLPPFLFYNPFDYERLFWPALNYDKEFQEYVESDKKEAY